ncbi:MAG: phenylalanine--tRNA ligase subunit alpha [Parcubacteria group bacterium]|nr:phenylalanine--tRNA ligase subunit alpha [Parcubacteria group bacterium]
MEMKDKEEIVGHLHPVTTAIRQACEVFKEMGFVIAEGPETEEEFFNFDALNVPADHPSRDMQDTFWLKRVALGDRSPDQNGLGLKPRSTNKLLRTHMTSVSLRELAKKNLPLRVISPGRVFRNEATDATHEAQFYQLDGLAVDKPGKITMTHLKDTLEQFYKKLAGKKVEMRFRTSFFPFVEPGVEVDIKWGDKWLEVCGAGMLHPNVFKAAGLDPKEWQGFAFGSTVDRMLMIKYGIEDIRLLYSGDLRFVNQF